MTDLPEVIPILWDEKYVHTLIIHNEKDFNI